MDDARRITRVCWTIDWQDNYLWQSPDFLSASQDLIRYAINFLDGKVTWFAEVDELTDITIHDGVEDLIFEIDRSGGEVGIHVHHTSVDPEIRWKHYKRAVERVRKMGGGALAYSPGMGNFIQEDVFLLTELGIKTVRSYAGSYVNASLPSQDWAPPDKRILIDTLFPPAMKKGIPDPRQNPVACDCRNADDRAGYLDTQDFHRVRNAGRLFAVPLGTSDENLDGEHQLHVQPRIPLERLKRIFKSYHARSERGVVFVACYFHPYDLTEKGTAISKRMAYRWQQIVNFQKQLGSEFLTMQTAQEKFDALVKKGEEHG